MLAMIPWWKKTVIYEVYPKSFLDTAGGGTGTIEGVRRKLDYFEKLGVGALWLTPVYLSPMKDNGYDVIDYRSIDPTFGTMEDMERLIADAKARGIKIIMDLVFNHTSDKCLWFTESRSSRDNPKADWYIWRDPAFDGGAPTNWRSIFGGDSWTFDEVRGQYYLHTFADFQPDLNWENPDVRKALFDIASWWVDKGVDGFRVDAVTYIKKPPFKNAKPDHTDGTSDIHKATANTSGILDFLREFKERVCNGRDVFCVGEANGVEMDELDEWVGEDGVFDMIFQFHHLSAVRDPDDEWNPSFRWHLPDLVEAIVECQDASEGGWCPVFFENHDQPRSPDRFLLGEADVNGTKMLATVLMCLRGTPFIYQGEELGYRNARWDDIEDFDDLDTYEHYDYFIGEGMSEKEALAKVADFSRDNARTPMQWEARVNAGFTTGEPWLAVHDDYRKCNVAVQDADRNSVLNWYRRLVEFRNGCEILIAGDFKPLIVDSERVFAFERSLGEKTIRVFANFSDRKVSYDPKLVKGLEALLSTHGYASVGWLRAHEAVVFG